MLENLILSVNIVLPMVLMMVLGYVLRRIGFIDEAFIRKGTQFSFAVAFPCSIFSNFVSLDLAKVFDVLLLVYMIAAMVLSVLVPLLLVPRFVKDRPTAASLVQAMFRANFLIQGIPLLTNAYGEGNIAAGAYLLPFLILGNNVLATVIFVSLIPEQRAGGHNPILTSLKKMAVNPLIIGSVVGIVFAAFRWQPPSAVNNAVTQLGRVGMPLAMVCMGAEIRLGNIRSALRYTVPSCLIRVIAVPLFTTLGAIALGYRGVPLGSAFLFTGTGTAAAGYVMSSAMGGNSDISAQCVGLSTILSAFTMTAGLFLLFQFNLI